MDVVFEDDVVCLWFYECLVDSEMFLLLVLEFEGDDDIIFEVIEVEGM